MRTLALILVACSVDPDAGLDSPAGSDDPPLDGPVEISDASFDCITAMEPVRGFYVSNLLGDIEATLAAADDPEATPFPPGSVVQLVPQEAMVKREPGFSAATGDWEFFFLSVREDGTTIDARGTTDVENVFGGNCFACHAPAAHRDFICERGHGCDDLPIGPDAFVGLQQSDPRCAE